MHETMSLTKYIYMPDVISRCIANARGWGKLSYYDFRHRHAQRKDNLCSGKVIEEKDCVNVNSVRG